MHTGGEGVQLHSFLNLALHGRSVVRFMHRPLYPEERALGTQLIRLGADMDVLNMRKFSFSYRKSNPRSSILLHSPPLLYCEQQYKRTPFMR
jgi:hypothetical protein